MSQKVNEKQNSRVDVTAKHNVQPPKIIGLSPDDDIGVNGSGDTSKPPTPPDQTPTP